MSEFERVFMWAVRLGALGLVLRWPVQVAGLVVGAVAWTAIGPWAGWLVLGLGLVAPRVWQPRRAEPAERREADRW